MKFVSKGTISYIKHVAYEAVIVSYFSLMHKMHSKDYKITHDDILCRNFFLKWPIFKLFKLLLILLKEKIV